MKLTLVVLGVKETIKIMKLGDDMKHDVYLAKTKTVNSDNDPGFEIMTDEQY